jgi:hypothetical protein
VDTVDKLKTAEFNRTNGGNLSFDPLGRGQCLESNQLSLWTKKVKLRVLFFEFQAHSRLGNIWCICREAFL